MAAPTLGDYEYQYKDTGVLLNQATSVMPFWDVEKISGLADFPELSYDVLDLDGQHGGFVTGNYFRHRVVVIEGTLYCLTSDVDINVELLKATILPDGIDYPLYWKHPSKAQRYTMGKPIAFASDIETGRRTGKVSYQLQIGCTDPRSYVDIASISWTTATNYSFTNAGNTASGQIISITAGSTTTANVTVSNQNQGSSFQFTTPITNGQVLTIDTEKLILRVNGVLRTANLTLSGTAWPIVNAGANTWRVTSNIGNGTATTKSAWL